MIQAPLGADGKMARKIICSYGATDDLDALAEYIARDSSFYAAAFTQQILDASRSLNEFSERRREECRSRCPLPGWWFRFLLELL
ncbi:MAG TPA: hypothetical protein DD719_08300 [Desulfotomaculum sp.]|nr:hypothetical protein [Desulfotomaculum sp.]HCJ79706.1 hypothetical protein [Desulfotomaculum sp.]